jgi:hypothetical protein
MVSKVELRVIGVKHPREDRILRQIIKWSIGKDIDFVDVVNIWDFSVAPGMSEVWDINSDKLLSLFF